MKTLEQSRQELIKRIEESFKDTPYPGDDHILHVYENPTSQEARDVVELKAFKRWQDVPFDILILHAFNLPFLSPEAFHFYIPAFMTVTLSKFDEVGLLADNTLARFKPILEDVPWKHSFFENARTFNAEQRKVIYEFIELFVAIDPNVTLVDFTGSIQRSKNFWKDFPSPEGG
jgi:hypothetical protein